MAPERLVQRRNVSEGAPRAHEEASTVADSRSQAPNENLSDCGRPGRRCLLLQPAFSEARPSGRGKAGIAFPSGEVVGRVQRAGPVGTT